MPTSAYVEPPLHRSSAREIGTELLLLNLNRPQGRDVKQLAFVKQLRPNLACFQ